MMKSWASMGKAWDGMIVFFNFDRVDLIGSKQLTPAMPTAALPMLEPEGPQPSFASEYNISIICSMTNIKAPVVQRKQLAEVEKALADVQRRSLADSESQPMKIDAYLIIRLCSALSPGRVFMFMPEIFRRCNSAQRNISDGRSLRCARFHNRFTHPCCRSNGE